MASIRGRAALASVIIPFRDGLTYTRQCLERLRAHTRSPYEILLVDNGSRTPATALARKHRARLIRNPENLGFAKAVNQGMRAAKGRYLLWLNNDVLVTPGWLEGLVAAAESSPDIAAVGPCTNHAAGFQHVPDPRAGDLKGLLRFSQGWALRHRGRVRKVHRLIGFCLLLKREVLDRVGLLDERFFPGYYEDYDYSLRLRQAGYSLAVAREVFVYHHGHRSTPDREQWLAQVRRSREVFLEKWCRRALEFLDELDPIAAQTNR